MFSRDYLGVLQSFRTFSMYFEPLHCIWLPKFEVWPTDWLACTEQLQIRGRKSRMKWLKLAFKWELCFHSPGRNTECNVVGGFWSPFITIAELFDKQMLDEVCVGCIWRRLNTKNDLPIWPHTRRQRNVINVPWNTEMYYQLECELIQEAKNDMKNKNSILNSSPPKSLLNYEAKE